MYKLVVFCAVLAVAVAKPHAVIQTYAAPATLVAAPSAVSHQSRVDVVSSPVVSTYAAAPVVSTYAAAPAVVAAAPAVVSAYSAVPAAVSHQSRVDVHNNAAVVSAYAAPVVSTYAATPVVSNYAAAPVVSTYAATPFIAAPAALAPNSPATVLNGAGVPLDTIDVVAARASHYQAKALAAHGIHKRSIVAAPVAYSSFVAPAAVSSSSRVDIHNNAAIPVAYAASPVVSTYAAAPVVSTYGAAPLVSTYAAGTPVVSAYSAPLVSSYAATPVVAARAYSVHPY